MEVQRLLQKMLVVFDMSSSQKLLRYLKHRSRLIGDDSKVCPISGPSLNSVAFTLFIHRKMGYALYKALSFYAISRNQKMEGFYDNTRNYEESDVFFF